MHRLYSLDATHTTLDEAFWPLRGELYQESENIRRHLSSYCLGLASTEDFTSVQLRRGKAVPHQNLLPYRDKMLLQVGLRSSRCWSQELLCGHSS